MKIWISTINHFKEGGKDEYKLLSTVPLHKGAATIDVSSMPADFYKIVLEGPDNMLNRWVVLGKKQ